MPSPKRRTLARLARKAASPSGPPGYGGGGWNGGSAFVDAFRSRRAPSMPEMVEAFKGVVFSCSALNQGGVARTRLGLYATTGQGQARPKCLTRGLGFSAKAMLRGRSLTKSAAWFQKNAHAADVDEVAEHPLLEMLAAVNDDWDYDLWVRYTVACLDVVGWFFHLPEASSSVRGKPVPGTLWPLLPQYVLPVRSPSGSLTEKYTYFDQSYLPHELVRGRFVSLKDPYGLGYGPTQAGFAYAGLSDQYASIQEDLLTQGGKISGYLTDADPAMGLGAAEGKRLETEVNSTWTRGNGGKLKYIPANLKFTAAQWAPTDLAALEVSDKALQLFANCFGVPLSLLKTEDVNLANAEAGHRQHAELAVDPRCTLIASSLTKWARRYGREHGIPGWDRLFFAFDNPVQEDRERNAAIHKSYVDSGVTCPNEVRAELGLEPYDGGDEFLRPGTLKTVDGIVNPPEPPPAAAAPPPPPKPPAAKAMEGEDRGFFLTKDADRGAESGGQGEENTFGLPEGDDIAAELKRWYERQRQEVLGTVETVGVPAPGALPALDAYDDPMARAFTPMLASYWDRAGKATLARLGLDPDEWRVTNPHLREMIHRAAYDFCASTNASTSKRLDHALAELHQSFIQGQVTQGETLPQLTTRVNAIFDGLSEGKAKRIAATEASRAVHAAQIEADKQSGVVAGTELLLSADACPLCRAIHDQCKRVRLGQPYAVVGDHPAYSHVFSPPLHVACCLPETPIVAPLGVSAFKADYDGPVVRIHLFGGSHVTVTPNHMLLTPQGFAVASSLMPGEHLIRDGMGKGEGIDHPDDYREPVPIKQVFNSWAEPERVRPTRVPVAPEYLHGDAALCQGEIHVVTAYGFLRDHLHPECLKPLPEGPLAIPDHPVPDFAGCGDLASVLFALRDATDGGVGGLRERQARLRSHAAKAVELTGGAVSRLDAGLDQSTPNGGPGDAEAERNELLALAGSVTPDDFGRIDLKASGDPALGLPPDRNAGFPESGFDGPAADAERLGECLDRLAGKVAAAKILDVEILHYVGPVYDVQTLTSLYLIGDGIVSSNCQCTAIDILLPQYGGPEHVEWGETLVQPGEAKPVEQPRPSPTPLPKPKPEPPPEPAKPAPHGPRVSAALDVTAKGKVGDAVRDALKLIDSVHGDGELPEIPVRSSNSVKHHGSYTRTSANRAVGIDVSAAGDHPRLTTAHEVGHFLDFAAMPGEKDFGGARDYAADDLFKSWLKAVGESDAVKSLRGLESTRSVTTPGGARREVPTKYVTYLLRPDELWARSYAQYVAMKGEDPLMKAELAGQLAGVAGADVKVPTQWGEADFGPIAREIDVMMRRLGWRK